MRAKLFIALGALVAIGWAVPSTGTAHFIAGAAQANSERAQANSQRLTLSPVRFRVHKDRGLLVDTWINGNGPYVFAVDTGAGMNLITQQVANAARLQLRGTKATIIGGLTNTTTRSNREAVINQLALGYSSNNFGARTALVVSSLAPGVDGILDPTDVYAPSGYSIDLPNQRIESASGSLSTARAASAAEGAVVPWVRLGGSIRPFVRLGDGRLALIDTGSAFGLAVNQRNAIVVGPRRNTESMPRTQDIAGGTINSRRVAPTTISIGGLVLRRIPTDILFGVADDAPLILGRDALYPFKITFDPMLGLIEFEASERS